MRVKPESSEKDMEVSIKTSGVYHIQISVSDLDRSLAFYTGLMGMEELFRADETVFLRTPGARELLALQPVEGPVDPKASGMDHFGLGSTGPSIVTNSLAASPNCCPTVSAPSASFPSHLALHPQNG